MARADKKADETAKGKNTTQSRARAIRRVKAEAAKAVSQIRRSTAPRSAAENADRLEPRIVTDKDPSALKYVVSQPEPQSAYRPVPEFEDLGELPSFYGTRRVYLVARDPHWFYAYWDLNHEQYQQAIENSHDGKVFLQLYTPAGTQVQQIQIPQGCRTWFINAGSPGSSFYAELGFYNRQHQFESLGRSNLAVAPRDFVSDDVRSRFVTIPFHFTFRQLLELVGLHMQDGEELGEAITRLQEQGFQFPFDIGADFGTSPDQQQMLLNYLGGEITRRINMGSYEISEVIRQRLQDQLSSVGGSGFALGGMSSGLMGSMMGQSISGFGGFEKSGLGGLSSGAMTSWGAAAGATVAGAGVSSFSSPGGAFGAAGETGRDRNFYMHVNAELIIYGGTDPNATVRIDGKQIKLRPDGTFSYHFSFPDGRFHIPIEATSPDEVETRSALLSFLRLTDICGEVEATGQPAHLREPLGRAQ